jgi:hypothetical protein
MTNMQDSHEPRPSGAASESLTRSESPRRVRTLSRIGLPAALVDPLLFVAGAVALFEIGLKVHRVAQYPGNIRLGTRLALLGPDLAFAVGFAATCIALGLVLSRLRLPRVALVLTQAFGLISIGLTTLAHGYFLASGQTLDYGMFAFALRRADETAGVVASEAHLPLLLALSIFALAVLLWPWYAWRVVRRTLGKTPRVSRGMHLGSVLAAIALATSSFYLTTLSPRRLVRTRFGHAHRERRNRSASPRRGLPRQADAPSKNGPDASRPT